MSQKYTEVYYSVLTGIAIHIDPLISGFKMTKFQKDQKYL